jgi:hypothetical protein
MKNILFALTLFLTSSDLMCQVYGLDLEESYDSIPAAHWNREFIELIDAKFDSLVKEDVDSIMVYCPISPFTRFALLTFKDSNRYCTLAFYQYGVLNKPRWEILSPSLIDSSDIFNFYLLFKNNKTRTVPILMASAGVFPIFGKFYFGKSVEIYGAFDIFLDEKFHEKVSQEVNRIIDREYEIYNSKNK